MIMLSLTAIQVTGPRLLPLGVNFPPLGSRLPTRSPGDSSTCWRLSAWYPRYFETAVTFTTHRRLQGSWRSTGKVCLDPKGPPQRASPQGPLSRQVDRPKRRASNIPDLAQHLPVVLTRLVSRKVTAILSAYFKRNATRSNMLLNWQVTGFPLSSDRGSHPTSFNKSRKSRLRPVREFKCMRRVIGVLSCLSGCIPALLTWHAMAVM